MTYQSQNKKRPFPYVALCLIAVAVLVVVILAYSILDSTGIIGRMGIPYRKRGVSIVSIAIDAPQDVISALFFFLFTFN